MLRGYRDLNAWKAGSTRTKPTAWHWQGVMQANGRVFQSVPRLLESERERTQAAIEEPGSQHPGASGIWNMGIALFATRDLAC